MSHWAGTAPRAPPRAPRASPRGARAVRPVRSRRSSAAGGSPRTRRSRRSGTRCRPRPRSAAARGSRCPPRARAAGCCGAGGARSRDRRTRSSRARRSAEHDVAAVDAEARERGGERLARAGLEQEQRRQERMRIVDRLAVAARLVLVLWSRWRSTKPPQLFAARAARGRSDASRARPRPTARRRRSAAARRTSMARCGRRPRSSRPRRARSSRTPGSPRPRAAAIPPRPRPRPPRAHAFNLAPASFDRPAYTARAPSSASIAQQPVVLGDAVRARERAGLDLPAAGADREIGDRGVLGLAGAVRHHRGVARRARAPHRLERLGQRPDLVHLDQDRVADALLDALRAGSSGWSRTGRRRRAACASRAVW